MRIYDPVLDGLRSAVRYDRTYFDKIVASLLPLLEKLTTGKIAQLLAPNYSDLGDPRPIFDWMQIIRKRAVVYVGLDALSDAEVAAAVGNSMFSDLVSVAGHIYKFGIDDGLPGAATGVKVLINVHADEFNELMGDEFIPMVNKGGGAGVQVTAYTQTLSDIEARIGNRAKAGQVIGNFNNLFMLRVRETITAELLTRQLPQVEVYTTSLVSGATDSSDPSGNTAFTSNTQDRVTSTSVPLIEPAHVVGLPKGQCFALIEGGHLWKVRMPLPAPDPDEAMPKDLQELAGYMRQHYVEAGDWWDNKGIPGLQDQALPDDLLADFKQMATVDKGRRHERPRRRRAAPAGSPAGPDRRPGHAAVPVVRRAVRLAAAVHRDRVHWDALLLARRRLASCSGHAELRAVAGLGAFHAQRAGAGTGRSARQLVEWAYQGLFVKTGCWTGYAMPPCNPVPAPAARCRTSATTSDRSTCTWRTT